METYQDSVKGRGCSTSLHMSQDGGTCVKAKPVSHKLQQTICIIIACVYIVSNFMLAC